MRALHVRILAGAFMLAAVAACTASASVGGSTTSTTCAQDSTVSCTDGTGWSCTGSDTPEDQDSTILCDNGYPSSGVITYCCVPQTTTTTTCGPDPSVETCQRGSFGFSCTNPTEDPSTAYPSFNCSTPVEGTSGNALYCCTDGTTTTTTTEDAGTTSEDAGTCALDENVVCSAGSGYSCLGNDMPPGLTCTTYLVSDAGISEYCCQ